MKAQKLNKSVLNFRTQLGLNQTDFGDKLGVSAMSVSRWETGANDPPAECIVKIATMADDSTQFWYFLEHIGLKRKNFKDRL